MLHRKTARKVFLDSVQWKVSCGVHSVDISLHCCFKAEKSPTITRSSQTKSTFICTIFSDSSSSRFLLLFSEPEKFFWHFGDHQLNSPILLSSTAQMNSSPVSS